MPNSSDRSGDSSRNAAAWSAFSRVAVRTLRARFNIPSEIMNHHGRICGSRWPNQMKGGPLRTLPVNPQTIRRGGAILSPSPDRSSIATISTATTAAVSAAAAAGAFLTRLGFFTLHFPAAIVLAVQRRDRRVRFLGIAHLDKAEALRAASFAIHD